MGLYPLIEKFIADQAQSGNILKMGKPGIRTFGWGQNYYVDEAGNKISNNPNMSYYYDTKGNIQYFGKPQIDWTKVKYGQNPFETPEALLGNETIFNQPTGTQPIVTQPTINQPLTNQSQIGQPSSISPIKTAVSEYLKNPIGGLIRTGFNPEFEMWKKNISNLRLNL